MNLLKHKKQIRVIRLQRTLPHMRFCIFYSNKSIYFLKIWSLSDDHINTRHLTQVNRYRKKKDHTFRWDHNIHKIYKIYKRNTLLQITRRQEDVSRQNTRQRNMCGDISILSSFSSGHPIQRQCIEYDRKNSKCSNSLIQC